FGGLDRADYLDDTWQWDGMAWVEHALDPRPTARYGDAMAYDAARGRIVVVGGDHPSGLESTPVWQLQSISSSPEEDCRGARDEDGLSGCDDPDCWAFCTPHCLPQATCDPDLPSCGDGI